MDLNRYKAIFGGRPGRMSDFFRLPGFSSGAPSAPAPLPPLPEREDPAVIESREKLRLSEKRRKGRAASILTGGQGVEDDLGVVTRPAGRSPAKLGG